MSVATLRIGSQSWRAELVMAVYVQYSKLRIKAHSLHLGEMMFHAVRRSFSLPSAAHALLVYMYMYIVAHWCIVKSVLFKCNL